jgi:hypothetical protein
MHYIAYDPALFINGKRSVAESHTEDRKYLCRFRPCNENLKRLYEIFEKSKKQDLTLRKCPLACTKAIKKLKVFLIKDKLSNCVMDKGKKFNLDYS